MFCMHLRYLIRKNLILEVLYSYSKNNTQEICTFFFIFKDFLSHSCPILNWSFDFKIKSWDMQFIYLRKSQVRHSLVVVDDFFSKTLTKRLEKNVDENYTRMLRAILPRGNTLQSSSRTATFHPSRKSSKLDEPDMQDTAGEVGTSSQVMYT